MFILKLTSVQVAITFICFAVQLNHVVATSNLSKLLCTPTPISSPHQWRSQPYYSSILVTTQIKKTWFTASFLHHSGWGRNCTILSISFTFKTDWEELKQENHRKNMNIRSDRSISTESLYLTRQQITSRSTSSSAFSSLVGANYLFWNVLEQCVPYVQRERERL